MGAINYHCATSVMLYKGKYKCKYYGYKALQIDINLYQNTRFKSQNTVTLIYYYTRCQ
jgi:hypothetical protein